MNITYAVHEHAGRVRPLRFRKAVFTGLLRLGPVRQRDNRNIELLAEGLELLRRRYALRVGRDHQRTIALTAKAEGQLRGRGRLTGALEPHEHDDGGRRLRLLQARVSSAEHLDHLLVDDVDDLLHRCEALRDVGSQRPLSHAGHELLDDLVVNVSLQQSEADLAQSLIEVLLGDGAATAQAAEYALELIGKGVEHIYKRGA